MLQNSYTTMNGIHQGHQQKQKPIEHHTYMTLNDTNGFLAQNAMTAVHYSTPISRSSTSYGTSYQPSGAAANDVSQQEPPHTEKQRCTRCKRWKEIHQFVNDDPMLPMHAGCLECRESARKYGQSEYGRATRRNYNQTNKAKETRKKYAQSEKGKESRRKYAQTEKAKEVRRKYNQSDKAKETRKKRAMVKSGRQQEQDRNKLADEQFDMMPALVSNITFDPSQGPSDESRSMEKAFWQTVSKTIYDRSKAQYDKYLGDHDDFEVDIRFKYKRNK